MQGRDVRWLYYNHEYINKYLVAEYIYNTYNLLIGY